MTTVPVGKESGVKHLARTGTVDSLTGDAFVMAPESPARASQPQTNGLKKHKSQPPEGAS